MGILALTALCRRNVEARKEKRGGKGKLSYNGHRMKVPRANHLSSKRPDQGKLFLFSFIYPKPEKSVHKKKKQST